MNDLDHMKQLILLVESAEQLEEGIADKVKGAILGAAITFAAVNTDLDKVFVEPEGGWPRGSLFDFKATDKPTNTTIAVVDPDTKEVKRVEPKVKPISTERVDYVMNRYMEPGSKIDGYAIDKAFINSNYCKPIFEQETEIKDEVAAEKVVQEETDF